MNIKKVGTMDGLQAEMSKANSLQRIENYDESEAPGPIIKYPTIGLENQKRLKDNAFETAEQQFYGPYRPN